MPPETRSAAEAFDALRAEVSETHAGMRKLTKMVADRPTPDYDLTLGQMAKRLGAMDDRLADLAHLMPRARLPEEIFLPHELAAITNQAKAAAQELRAATGAAIEQQAVCWWMVGIGGVGVLLGILLCLGTVALLPRAAGAWVAASIVGGDPWTAGQNLMREGDPATFERMVRLYQACPQNAAVELCRAAMAVKAAEAAARPKPTQ
jgi:hypothetical protein